MADWRPDLSQSDKPRYLAIADAIADDIAAGKLLIGDRLPPQRKLAKRLDIDFTTAARGYVEARKRGLIESKVGQGTFVRQNNAPAWFTIWLKPTVEKSANCISTIGRIPSIAAPTANPMMASSLMGESSTRPGNSPARFLVALNAPPNAPTSCP